MKDVLEYRNCENDLSIKELVYDFIQDTSQPSVFLNALRGKILEITSVYSGKVLKRKSFQDRFVELTKIYDKERVQIKIESIDAIGVHDAGEVNGIVYTSAKSFYLEETPKEIIEKIDKVLGFENEAVECPCFGLEDGKIVPMVFEEKSEIDK